MTYTSQKRVIRDGRLVAYAGETMTDAEARRRGLVTEDVHDVPTPALDSMTVREPREVAKSKGIKIPARAKREDILKMLR